MARCPTCHRRLVSGQSCPEHGGAPVDARDASDTRATPAWSQPLGGRLGSGGFADVWEIVDGGVLKVAHANHELARAQIAREAASLRAIGGPAVPRLFDHGVLPDGRPWLAMERITGTSLADLIAHGRVGMEDVVAIGSRFLDSLARIHAAGFIHRDIKPDNVIRRADGSVVIFDLGLARKYPDDPDDPTRANVQVGSLEYIAPEQLVDAAAVDPRADLYAFGCVLFELAAGRPPFLGDAAALERAHAALRPPALGALVSSSGAIETLCHDLLAKEPARRPASAAIARARLLATRDAPSISIEARSVSMISEGTQPVVLLWVELPRVDRAVLARLVARKIVVLSQRGRRVFGVLLGLDHGDPAAAAISAARDLAAIGARIVLHLDLVRISVKDQVHALGGLAIEAPETWLPQGEWTGVLLTRAFAAVAQTATRATDGHDSHRVLAEPDAVTLFGREALLTDLLADAAATLTRSHRAASVGPAFAVVSGEPGVGKTVFATELASRLRGLGARVQLATIPPPGTTPASYTALADLVGTPGGRVVQAIGDALRDAARARPIAIVIDDLHLADHELLDALEYATLGGESLPLWIVAFSRDSLRVRRPNLGARAERHRRDLLAPLDEDAALALTTKLLEPAKYPPLRALRKLATLARGNPLHLTMLAREVHERGAIRARPNGEYFLDTTALDALPPIALGPWLAARELAAASPELVGLARLCAVLGGEIKRVELIAVVEAVERRGGASTPIDVDVGLRELAALQVLVPSGHGWRFRQTLLEDGVYTTTAEDDRRVIHQAALAYWRAVPRSDDPAIIERIARHAQASDDHDVAATAFATLGARAHAEHRIFDADQAWERAVVHLPDHDLRRARALLGRARARLRLLRISELLADLEEVIAIATALGDLELEIEARLEQATALDLSEDFTGSREAAGHARRRIDPVATTRPDLVIDLELAEGRSVFRDQHVEEAIGTLRAVHARARRVGLRDTETVAALLLAPALVSTGELDAAAVVFDQLIELCERRGDRFHLGAAYVNRAWLWSARGETERTAADLRLVIQLAREGGQPHLERNATYNLAEDRLWQGALDEASQLAHRSLALQTNHGEGPTQLDQLLLARVLGAADARAELVPLLDALEVQELGAIDRVVVAVLRSVASGRGWETSLAQLASLPDEVRLELAHLAHRAGRLAQLDAAQRDELVQLAARNPFWHGRFV